MTAVPLLVTFVHGSSLLRETDLPQGLPIVGNGPPGTFVRLPDGLRVSLPTDQIVYTDEVDACVRVGFGGMRFDGLNRGRLRFTRVREMHPESELSPARSHTMLLEPSWVGAIVVDDREAWSTEMMSAWCREAPPPQLLAGIAEFNRGEYFEQHETLELLWRAEPRPVRQLYQGILQIGVAFHHIRRANHHGAVYMLRRGALYLQPFAPCCQSVDVAALLDDAAAALAAVERLGASRLPEFDWSIAPTVRLRVSGQ